MNQVEELVFHRPAFAPHGVLVARRELRFGARTYAPTESLPADHGLDERTVRNLWEQFAIDTYAPGAYPETVIHADRVDLGEKGPRSGDLSSDATRKGRRRS